jgi:hypothetical protein
MTLVVMKTICCTWPDIIYRIQLKSQYNGDHEEFWFDPPGQEAQQEIEEILQQGCTSPNL